jgi:hypothetical protein
MIQIQTHSRDVSDRNQSYIFESTLRRMSQQNDAKTVVGDDDDDDDSIKKRFQFASWLMDLEELYSKCSFAVILENKGNTARDHLGNSLLNSIERVL